MSIEEALAANTKAMAILTESVNKQNDLSERMIGLKSEAIETVKQVAAKPTETVAKATKTAEKPPETKVEEAPMDPIAQAITEYVTSGYDLADPAAADERAARSAKVKTIFAAIAGKASVSVTKHSEIPASFHGAFLKTLAKRVEEGCLVIGKTADGEIDLDA